MKCLELKVARIGNSRGVRLPAQVLRRYGVGRTLLLEQRPDEMVLRAQPAKGGKLSWEDTYREMAKSGEDWSDWEAPEEGLVRLPGESGE